MVQKIGWLLFFTLLASLESSESQESGRGNACYEGFVTTLPDPATYDQFTTLFPTSTDRTFIYPQIRFNCEGIITQLMIPWQTQQTDDFQNESSWNSTGSAYLSIWRQANGLSVRQQQYRIQTKLGPEPSKSRLFSGILRVSPMLTVQEDDYIGFTLPGHNVDADQNNVYNHLPVLRPRTWDFANCRSDIAGNLGTIANCLMQVVSNPVMQISFRAINSNISQFNNSVERPVPKENTNSADVAAALGTLIGLLLVAVIAMGIVIGILLIRTQQCRQKRRSKSGKNYRSEAHNREPPNTLTPMLTSKVQSAYETVKTLPLGATRENSSQPIDDTDTVYEQPEEPTRNFLESEKINTFVDTSSSCDYEYSGVSYVPGSKERQRNLHVGSDTAEIENEELYVYADPHSDRIPAIEDDDSLYWEPGHTAPDIYDQMSSKKFIEVSTSAIKKSKLIGTGEFGLVYDGKWHLSTGKTTDVALKMLKPSASGNDKVKLLQEAAFIGQFRHPHIVQLYGVQTLAEPVTIVLELLPKGDLRSYLLQLQTTRVNTPVWSEMDNYENTCTVKSPVQFCKEIADGMKYLSKKGFIHRDLAARNVLLTEDYHCKIADFGLCKDLSEDTYYITKGGRIPLKWTAPEAVLYRKYSTKSDVWSYGMVMYEIWSLGRKPFDDWEIQKVVEILETDFYLPSPSGCPQNIYQLMVSCWNRNTELRATFEELYTALHAMCGSEAVSNKVHHMQ